MNIVNILSYLTTDATVDLITAVANKIELDKLSKLMNIYKGQWKGISTSINFIYLSLLYNFSKLLREQEDLIQYRNATTQALYDFLNYYSIPMENGNSNYINYKIKKQTDIEIHERALKIAFDFSTDIEYSNKLLLESYFVNDLLGYLYYLQKGRTNNGRYYDCIELLSKEKKLDTNKASKIITKILDISLLIFQNILDSIDSTNKSKILEVVKTK
jgi:hypothetical protein